MKVAIGSDHAGFALKESLRERLSAQGHQVLDYGTHGTESTDYPDYAAIVARQVSSGAADRGVLVCSTGAGMAIAANKICGVRAAVGMDPAQVRLSREHNDANILAFGAKFTELGPAGEMLDVFFDTAFEGGRHARRVAKIAQLERQEDTK